MGENSTQNIPITFDQYLRLVAVAMECKTYRIGQAYWNVLANVREGMAETIRESKELDPYYDDSRVANFLAHVYQNWDKKSNE